MNKHELNRTKAQAYVKTTQDSNIVGRRLNTLNKGILLSL